MPIYGFKNTETGEVIEKTMSISEYDDFKDNNPEWVRHYAPTDAPKTVAGVNQFSSHTETARKKHSGWNQLLTGIKDQNPSLKIDD